MRVRTLVPPVAEPQQCHLSPIHQNTIFSYSSEDSDSEMPLPLREDDLPTAGSRLWSERVEDATIAVNNKAQKIYRRYLLLRRDTTFLAAHHTVRDAPSASPYDRSPAGDSKARCIVVQGARVSSTNYRRLAGEAYGTLEPSKYYSYTYGTRGRIGGLGLQVDPAGLK
jgi:hypothetical protein